MPRQAAAKKSQPELDVPEIRRQRPELPIRCEDCVFLHRYQTYGLPCDQLGSLPSSLPCARFQADPARLGSAREVRDILGILAEAQNPAALYHIMTSTRRVKRHRRTVGEVVYFRVLGGEFLTNYAFGVVTGATADRLIVAGSHGFVAFLAPENVMSRAAWEETRDRLVRLERINDPQGGLRRLSTRGQSRLVSYEPPIAQGARKRKGPRSSFGGKKKQTGKGPIVLSSGDVR